MVETVEEAEAILRELWFGWFEGIYNKDEDQIREVVGTAELLSSGLSAFSTMQFLSVPRASAIQLPDLEILRANDQCLAVWSGIEASFRTGSSEGAQVVRWTGDRWVLVSVWAFKEDLWDADCVTQLRPLP